MKRFSFPVLLPVLSAAVLLAGASPAKACCLFNWWGASYGSSYSAGYSVGYGPTFSAGYSVGYAPSYSTYYAPTYTASYVPNYSTYYAPTYTASYVPSTTYYVSSVPTATASACCDVQTSYSAPSACCAPCTSCVACCPEDCPLDSAGSSSGSDPTPVTPRPEGPQRGDPTFMEEEDRGGDPQYDADPMTPGTGDGFSPRGSAEDSTNAARETLQFKVPEAAPADDEEQTQPVKRIEEPAYPVLNLDDKITSRPSAQRTRLIARRSWEQPELAKNITRRAPVENEGWVPVPLPTQLVQK